MAESYKEDNNCIIKAFENNPISILQENIDDKKIYYFKSSDIGKALDLKNIRVSIQQYDGDEVVVRKAYDQKGVLQDASFLSSQGVYRLLYSSRKDIAKKFRKWAGNILDDIIFNESKELQLQLEQNKLKLIEQSKLLEQKEEELEVEKEIYKLEKEQLLEDTLIDQFKIDDQCIYYGLVDDKDTKNSDLIKFGHTNNLKQRVKDHKLSYTNFRLIAAFKVKNKIYIEKCIKSHKILKKQIRNVIINGINYTELLAINNDEFDLDTVEYYIKEIISQNEYNLENYNKLLLKCETLESDLYKLQDKNKDLVKELEVLQGKLENFTPIEAFDSYKFKSYNRTETKYGYKIYAFSHQDYRFKIGLCKNMAFETYEKSYKSVNPEGKLLYCVNLKHPFLEKTLIFLLKRDLLYLNPTNYEGDFSTVKSIIDIIVKLEEFLTNKDLENIRNLTNDVPIITEKIVCDYETPSLKIAKRSIDQIDIETGKIINSFESIESAGKSFGLTSGSAIGMALRNKTKCQGYLFRYSGISLEDQYAEQSVIKINCSTGHKTYFKSLESAGKDEGIMGPTVRRRILTDVHINGHHWIFDKTALHYNGR